MTRNISIQEFIDSFELRKDSFFPITFRYLYNADFQNGLYIDKSPIGSGSTVLNNLLILYRIAKYLTFGVKENEDGYVSIYDDHPDLAFATFTKDMLSNTSLFVESTFPEEDAVLDQKHIYYCAGSYRVKFCFGENLVQVFFNNIRSTLKIDLPGIRVPKTRLSNEEAVKSESYGIKFFLGFMVTSTSAEINVQEKIVEWFDKVLEAGAFKHKNLRLNPFENARVPFVILSKETTMTLSEKLTKVEFNDRDIIEINNLPFAKDFMKKVLPSELRVGKMELTFPFYVEGVVRDGDPSQSTKEAFLKERYGLYKKWDYDIKEPPKVEFCESVDEWNKANENMRIYDRDACAEALSKEADNGDYQLEDSDSQKEFETMLSTDKTFAQLIANQSKYMAAYLDDKDDDFKKNLFKELSGALGFRIRSEAEFITYLMEIYKFLKKQGLPIAVAETARVFKDVKVCIQPISNTAFSKCLIEHPKFTVDAEFNWELVILIPVIFEDVKKHKDNYCVYGGWRKIQGLPKNDGLLRM